MIMEPVTSNEPSVIIMASNPDALPLLKSMIARAHSRRDHERARTLIGVRQDFRSWIDSDRLRRAKKRTSETIYIPDKEPGVETGEEEKETAAPVLDHSPDGYDDR